jgi:hypothetical protein
MLYRCTNKPACGARRSLKRRIEDYVRVPVCLACGGKLTRDKAQETRNKANTCTCDGLPYPHRKGSDVWCVEHETGPSDEDYRRRYGYPETD